MDHAVGIFPGKGKIWHRYSKETTKWIPTFPNVVNQQGFQRHRVFQPFNMHLKAIQAVLLVLPGKHPRRKTGDSCALKPLGDQPPVLHKGLVKHSQWKWLRDGKRWEWWRWQDRTPSKVFPVTLEPRIESGFREKQKADPVRLTNKQT